MSLNELLQKLSELGVKLWSEGDNLRVKAPKDSLTPELRDLLRLRKTELLSLQHTNGLADGGSIRCNCIAALSR
jgi:pyochelin synthetase